jgi:hypothetical protein
MSEAPADFGTGLRAHLGLEQTAAKPEPLEVAVAAPALATVEPLAGPVQVPDTSAAALAAREAELEERERRLALRETDLEARAAGLVAAAKALYDGVPGRGAFEDDDELARLRRRKTVA